MKNTAVLVDFDNCRNERLKRAIGRGKPSLSDYSDVFNEIISGVINALRTSVRSQFDFRFYGGWFESVSGDPTDLHNMVIQCIAQHPRQLSGQRLNFEVAYAPLFRGDMRLEATLRTESWKKPDGQVNDLATCMKAPGDSKCQALHTLSCWMRGRCPEPNCSRRLGDVASRRGQKIVDTLVVADAVIAGVSGIYDEVVILSADEDLLPGLLFRGNRACTMALVRLNYSSNAGRYDAVLRSEGINIYDI